MNKTTNVNPDDLNYDHYETEKYDTEIRKSIPGYENLHREIEKIIGNLNLDSIKSIADLGCGTGITSQKIVKKMPHAKLTLVDFSKTMLEGAKHRLKNYNIFTFLGDYATLNFGTDFDIIVSVIGIHHQNNEGKKALFKKIFEKLKPTGIFIFGDLVTYKDKYKAALNEAYHYAYLVKNNKNEQSLAEWAHHHKFLNDLAPLEDQINWLKEIGFSSVELKYEKYNTALILAKK